MPSPLVWLYRVAAGNKPELSYWTGWTGNVIGHEPVRIYDLGNKDWLIVGVGPGPQFKHAGLSLFHVPLEEAKEEAARLVHDLWG